MERNYVILAYKLPGQMARMIRRLSDGPDTRFYVHVDRTFDMEPFIKACDGIPGVFFLTGDDRVHSYWGDYGTAQATLNAMRRIVRDGRKGFVILLSGQDYPIRSNKEINAFLERNADHDFSPHFSLPSETCWAQTRGGRNRLEYYHVSLHRPGRAVQSVDICPFDFSPGNLKKILYVIRFRPDMFFHLPRMMFVRRKKPDCLQYYGGETWWVMRTATAAAILEFLERHPEVPAYFREVNIPEEIMFASLLKTLPGSRDVVRDTSLRLICWDDADSSSPQLFTSEHRDQIEAAMQRDDLLFARKFDETQDSAVLDWLDRKAAETDAV